MVLLVETMSHTSLKYSDDPEYMGEEGLITADENLHEDGYYEEVTDETGNHLGWVVAERK